MKINKSFKIMGLLLAVTMLGACSSGANNEEVGDKPLIYGSSEITSINPVLYEHGEINSLIFGGLMKHGEKNILEPHLAKSVELSEDNLVYTVVLRDDVLWHDGEPFTAKDVKFTLESILDEDNGSEIASNYEEIEEIIIEDDTHLKIVLSKPNVAMLDYLTIGLVPAHILEGKDLATDEFNRKPIGTGPYKVTDFTLGEAVTLKSNENYFKQTPAIKTIIFKFTTDSKTRSLQLKANELDLALITPQDALTFPEDKYKVLSLTTADYRGILYNFNSEFFDTHRELPNILSYGVDRQAIIDSVLLGHGVVAYSPLQGSQYLNENMEKFSYNPERVKTLLEENDWTMGDDGIYFKNQDRLSFVITCMEGDETRVDIARLVAQQFKDLGIEVKIEVSSNVDWEGQDAFLIGWGSPFDPDDHTYKVFGTDKGSNYSAYSNLVVDELLTKARGTTVVEERKAYYDQFQEELAKDMPYTFIAYIDAIYVMPNEILGISEDTVLGHHGVGLFNNVEEWSFK